MKIIPIFFRKSVLISSFLCLWIYQQGKAQDQFIDQIHFSKDSSRIIGFSLNTKTYNLTHSIPQLQWAESLNHQNRIQYKIIESSKKQDGIN